MVATVRIAAAAQIDQSHSPDVANIIHGSLGLTAVTVTVTVTKVFLVRFLLKDRKCITESFTYIQRSPG